MAPSDSQWFFTDEEIMSTPSIKQGMSPKQERLLRAKGTNFILQAAVILKIPQVTIGSASTFFHRFYMRASIDQKLGYHHYTVAATALFLATKTEETCRKTKEIVIACTKVAQKNPDLIIDEQSTEYWRWRDSILLYEEMLLETLTFDLVLESPYNLLYSFLRQLHIQDNHPLRNDAWAFVNDGCHTTICLSLPARDIAVAAVYFSARYHKETIPDDEKGNPWWVRLGGTPRNIMKGVTILNKFYLENPLMKRSVYEQSPVYNPEDLNRSRRGFSADITTPSPGPSQMTRNDSQMSNGAANGTGESSQVSKTNGRMEKSSSSNGVAKSGGTAKNDLPKTKDDLGGSDAALKEAANDPATHAPDTPVSPNQHLKRKTPGVEEPSAKRPRMQSNGLSTSQGEGAGQKSSNGTTAGESKRALGEEKRKGEESEEGELEE